MFNTPNWKQTFINVSRHRTIPTEFDSYPHECPDHRVPEHEEVESYEEAQQPATVAHQGQQGVGLLLPQQRHRVTGKHRDQHCANVGPNCVFLSIFCDLQLDIKKLILVVIYNQILEFLAYFIFKEGAWQTTSSVTNEIFSVQVSNSPVLLVVASQH